MPIEFHRDGPWELPEGWVWARLGDVSSHPGRIDPARQMMGNFRYIDLSAIEQGKVTQSQTLPVAEAPSRARQPIQSGDTLLSCVRVYLRNNVIVPNELNGSVASTAFCVLRPSEAIDPHYLFWFVHSRKFTEVLIPLQRGNSPPAVLDDDVREQHVPIPPLAEQRRIVARIDELFTEIADGETSLARARADLDTWRRALLKAAVTGELTREWRKSNRLNSSAADTISRIQNERGASFGRRQKHAQSEISEEKSLPTDWTWANLEDIGAVESGQTPTGIANLTSSQGEIPWFKVSSMNTADPDGWLSESQWYLSENDARTLRLRVYPRGTIVFPKRGGAILTNKKRRLGVQGGIDLNTMGYVPHAEYSEYLWTFFKQLDLKTLYDGSNVPQINYGDIAYVRVPVPPPKEGVEIARQVDDFLSEHDETMIAVDGSKRDSAKLRQSILKAAFEGRLVEQDPRDEPADRLLARLSEPNELPTRSRRKRQTRRAPTFAE